MITLILLFSVACAESTGELKEGHRNRWFIFFTNFAIDAGFVVAALVPMIVVLIFGQDHQRAAWRICLGLGVVPPLSLLYLRLKLNEPEEYNRNKMNNYPWLLIFRFYWKRLSVVSIIWFLYNFSSYSFGIYSSQWIQLLLPVGAPLWKSFGWNIITNLFYIPGSAAGAFVSDWIGPKRSKFIILPQSLAAENSLPATTELANLTFPSIVHRCDYSRHSWFHHGRRVWLH